MRHLTLSDPVVNTLKRITLWWVRRRDPDTVIRLNDERYVDRYKVIPSNRLFNVFVHRIHVSDDDRALHDHPWSNVSILLDGMYLEQSIDDREGDIRCPGDVIYRRGDEPHRLMLPFGPVLTIFVRFRSVREWGFVCEDGRWFHWRRFLARDDRTAVNICDEGDQPGDVPGRGPYSGADGERA